MSQPKVAVLLVNWNGREDTLACLASLRGLDYPNFEVIVVDNGSSDGSLESIPAQFPEARLLPAGDNLGFVGANNLGIQAAQASGAGYVLLLNNDTEVAPDFLTKMVAAAQADPTVGMVGPAIYYFSQPGMFWSAGGEIDWRNGVTHMLGAGQMDCGQLGSQPRRVDFVSGCALLVRMPVIAAVGVLDPRFHAYFEETEWCVRASRAGYRILQVPEAKVWHKVSPENEEREASPQVQYYMTRNRLLFLRLTRAGLGPMLRTQWDLLKRLLSWTVKPRWRGKSAQRDALARALLDFYRGRFGRVDLRSPA